MTELQRKNLVIAEFIGTKEDSISALKYHESWDWLMPVVAKITRNEWSASLDPQLEYLIYILPFGYIEDVYQATHYFINKLNQNT
jgi:hypothetical protein